MVPPCEEPSFSLGPRAGLTPLAVSKPERSLPIPIADRAPAACDSFTQRKRAVRCPATRQAALGIVDAALRKDIEERDVDLAAIEGCDALPAGAVRALRAELAPRICRDVVAEPASRVTANPEIAALLRAQIIEARLERAGSTAPAVPFDAVDDYVSRSLMPWLLETLSFIRELDAAAPSSGAGRAIVTLARGRALLRLAALTRSAVTPTPTCDRRSRGPAPFCPTEMTPARTLPPVLAELGDDLEKKGMAALRRGLRELADSGIIDDGRGHEATARIDHERRGSGPPPITQVMATTPTAEAGGVTGRLVRRLPVPLVPSFLTAEGAADITVMRALTERGLPGAWAAAPGTLPPAQALSAGRARFALALRYQRRADLESALAYAQSVDVAALEPDDRAWVATAVGLRSSMGGERPIGGPLGPLAAVAASEGPTAGVARFNLEVLAVAASRRAHRPFSPVSCRRAWDAVRKTGATLEQRAWVEWCVQASDAWVGPPRAQLCGSP